MIKNIGLLFLVFFTLFFSFFSKKNEFSLQLVTTASAIAGFSTLFVIVFSGLIGMLTRERVFPLVPDIRLFKRISEAKKKSVRFGYATAEPSVPRHTELKKQPADPPAAATRSEVFSGKMSCSSCYERYDDDNLSTCPACGKAYCSGCITSHACADRRGSASADEPLTLTPAHAYLGLKARNRNFVKCDLHSIDFGPARDSTRTDLSGSDFSGANLSGCNFTKADLSGCNFSHANLTRCRFAASSVSHAIFDHTTVAGADFKTARAFGCIVQDTDFTEAWGWTPDAVINTRKGNR